MPWCEECAKYWTPNSVKQDGTCPKCGMQLHAPDGEEGDGSGADGSAEEEKAPWHFKLMVVAVAAYLGWRLVELFV